MEKSKVANIIECDQKLPSNWQHIEIVLFLLCSRAHAQDIRRQTAQELKGEHGAAEKAAAIAQRIGRSSVTSISSISNAGSVGSGSGSFLHPGSSQPHSSASVSFGDVSVVRMHQL